MEVSEKTLQELLSKIDKLEHDTAKNAARDEVMNVAMKYFHYHQSIRDDLIVQELLAKNSPDIHSEHGASGVYEGYEHVAMWWDKRPAPPGKVIFHTVGTPVLEVADDLKTAKAVFLLMGVECGATKPGLLPEIFVRDIKSKDGRDIWAHWGFAKYGIDFIKEDGKWKIWHFHAYDLFRATFDKDWISLAQELAEMNHNQAANTDEVPNKIQYFTDTEAVFLPKADKPTTFHFDYDGMNTRMELFPPMPESYKTFDETFSY